MVEGDVGAVHVREEGEGEGGSVECIWCFSQKQNKPRLNEVQSILINIFWGLFICVATFFKSLNIYLYFCVLHGE